MHFSEVVNRVIELATAIRDYWDAELPKRHPKYPLVQSGEDSGPPPPEEAELRAFLQSRPDEVYKLLALADVGRGLPASDFEKRWREYVKDAPELRWAIEYQLGTAPLADYLTDGLHELSAAGVDVDNCQPAHV